MIFSDSPSQKALERMMTQVKGFPPRGSGVIAFATVEPSVAVNHAGTIITKEPIIFGEEGYIEFDDNSSPNFLGDEMSIEEFLNTDFDQDEDESQTMGGMQL